MYLSRLEIQGFKSFANKVTLDFERGITAIVGPNGSGKSNVADAMRWVLGEQSLKLLRGKRSDDVIFAGSDKKSRLGVAEVSLYLNNEDRGAPIDYSEIVITRRVFRDGEGEYIINHQPARLQDIQLLLAQANFGQRTYSVIGQGMIDSFLISGPQERKHLFDEAAGVRQYQMKKDQALQKLGQTKENLHQGETLMGEIEPRLRSLTRQVRRLERREEVEKSLREKQRVYFGLRWKEVAGELQKVNQEFSTVDQRRQKIEHELATIQQELETIEKERTASEVFTGLQKKYNEILDAKNSALQEQAVMNGKIELEAKQQGAGESVYLAKQVTETKRQLDQLLEEVQAAEHDVQRQGASLAKTEQELAAAEQAAAQLEQQLKGHQEQWKQNFTWPEAQTALQAFFAKYHEFVEELHQPEAPNSTAWRTRAAGLRDELRHLLDRINQADTHTDSQLLLTLPTKLAEASRQRQTAMERVMSIRSDIRLAEQQRQQLTEAATKLAAEFQKLERESSLEKLAASSPQQAQTAYRQAAIDIDRTIATLDEQLQAARTSINNFNAQETAKKDRLFTLQKAFRDTQHQFNAASTQTNELQVHIARLEQRQEDLKREIVQAMSLEHFDAVMASTKHELVGDITILAEEIGHLNHQLQLIGGIDEQITSEFQETNERWEFLNGQAEDLRAGIISLEKAVGELDTVIKERFNTAFKKINDEFNQYFRTLFRGGKAELVLIKETPQVAGEEVDDDATEADGQVPAPTVAKKSGEKVITGIDIKATPPGKKLQNIAMLSGGEKALTSIALLCAIISNNPSPFVALDEVDAALDEANSQRFAAILEQLAHKTQFITITHNRATMEKAAILYGVTMGDDGVSQLLSVHMDEAEKIIQQHGNR